MQQCSSHPVFHFYLCGMISNFVTEVEGISFQFNTVNAERLQLFQVYVMEQGVRKRFHMQLDPKDNRFRIMDREACPASCLPLEVALHTAIMENYQHMNHVPR